MRVPQAGDVWRRKAGRQHTTYILIDSVDETHAHPVPVVRAGPGWRRTRGRTQAIGLGRFTAANYEFVVDGVVLVRRTS